MGIKHNTAKTDVLVIGGGGAAARAAIEADEQGASVLMVTKDDFGEGGATGFRISHAAGYQAAFGHADVEDNPEVHFSDIMNAGLGMCNEKLARIVAYEAPKRLLDLEKWGASFEKINGKYAQRLGCFSSRPRMCEIKNHGYYIINALKKEVERRDIEIRENVMITNLLTQNNTCVGASGIGKKGDFTVFNAKSTILATGGGGNLYSLNLNPPEITGDGYAMALRAGVEMVNMEFLQIGMGIIGSNGHPPLLFGLVWSLHPDIYNACGERFIERYVPRDKKVSECFNMKDLHYPFSTRDDSMYVDIAIFNEINAGRGTKSGGVYLDLRKIPESTFVGKAQLMLRWLQSLGIDLLADLIQVAPFAHAFNGGIRINEKAETTLPGLYAAGEVAGGPHGADRLGGNMLACCQVFGAKAGEYAAKRALTINHWTTGDADKEYERLTRTLESKAGVAHTGIEKAIQEVMWKNVLTVRNEAGLKECERELERLRKHYCHGYLENDRELFRALAIQNLLDVGQVVTTAALLRRESRGSHYREDYPHRDDKNWMKSIIITQKAGKIETYFSPLAS